MQKAYKFFDSDENGKCETSKWQKKRDILTYYDCCLTNIGWELHHLFFGAFWSMVKWLASEGSMLVSSKKPWSWWGRMILHRRFEILQADPARWPWPCYFDSFHERISMMMKSTPCSPRLTMMEMMPSASKNSVYSQGSRWFFCAESLEIVNSKMHRMLLTLQHSAKVKAIKEKGDSKDVSVLFGPWGNNVGYF